MSSKVSNENQIYDVAIIGGGITGIGIFRDLSLHGITSVMIEKNKFCSETSSKSSKMLHGGVRYLEQLDFSLVRDALQEKDLWLKLCPKHCYPQTFYLPLYKSSKHSPLLIRLGMILYSKILSRNATFGGYTDAKNLMTKIPELKKTNLKGAGVYTDAIMDDWALGIACLKDALSYKKGHAIEETEVINIKKENEFYELTTNHNQTFKARYIVMATGPFTDQVARKLISKDWKNIMVPSKGTHLWLRKDCLKLKSSVVLVTHDNRVVFVIPQEKGILLGTTDDYINEDFGDVKPSDKEIEYLLGEVNNYFPNANINHTHITGSYAGVRPLVKDPSASKPGEVSRHHQVKRIDRNFYLIAGGKYTTFRLMAQDIVRPIANQLGVTYDDNKTLEPLRDSRI